MCGFSTAALYFSLILPSNRNTLIAVIRFNQLVNQKLFFIIILILYFPQTKILKNYMIFILRTTFTQIKQKLKMNIILKCNADLLISSSFLFQEQQKTQGKTNHQLVEHLPVHCNSCHLIVWCWQQIPTPYHTDQKP